MTNTANVFVRDKVQIELMKKLTAKSLTSISFVGTQPDFVNISMQTDPPIVTCPERIRYEYIRLNYQFTDIRMILA